MSAAARAGGGRGRIRRAGRRYVRAKGGARRAAASASSGQASTGRLGGFLGNAVRTGFAEAARSLGVEILGRSVESVLAAILNAVAPSGTTDDDATARRATNETLTELFQRYGAIDGGLDRLDAMDADTVRDAIQSSVSSYVYQRWLLDLSKSIEDRSISAEHAIRLERDVKVYVRDLVELELADRDVLNMDWQGEEGRTLIRAAYEQAYTLLGGR
jgi:hypothetical protein